MGAGKTTTSNLLAKDLPRTAIVGMDKIRHFISDAEKGPRDNAIARDVTLVMTKKYLELGLSVIVEQPFKTGDEIGEYEKMAKEHSIPFFKYELFTTPDNSLKRVLERQTNRGSEVSEERFKQIKHNISLYKTRADIGFEVIDTTDLKPEVVSARILNDILSQVE